MSTTSNATIQIQFLTLAQRGRREDWAVARADVAVPDVHIPVVLIYDYSNYGRLTVEAPSVQISAALGDKILEAYYRAGVPDRYAGERDLYGIWNLATMPDNGTGPKAYMIHLVRHDEECRHCGYLRKYGTDEYGTCDSRCEFVAQEVQTYYRRVEAPTLAEALRRTQGSESEYYTYGIMGADYAEARGMGINFFEGDGLLV